MQSVFLIQTSATEITENQAYSAADVTTGPRFCDDILKHERYFNAEPYWREEGFGRYEAWQDVGEGDRILLYCTSSIDEYAATLSHILSVEEREIRSDGALLRLGPPRRISPPIDYQQIHQLVENGRFSERMRYCGQQGFNFTKVARSDLQTVEELREVKRR